MFIFNIFLCDQLIKYWFEGNMEIRGKLVTV